MIRLYKHTNFGGTERDSVRITPAMVEARAPDGKWFNLGQTFGDEWNDTVTGVSIYSGVWRLWENNDRQGANITLPPGNYANLHHQFGFGNDTLSSVELVG